MKHTALKIPYLILLVLFISGCAGVHPLSNYARTGDTVMVALGGEHIRTTVAVLKKENISVNIIDYSSNTHPVKLRRLFKVTPSLASRMNYAGLNQGSYEFNQGAYQGMWLGIIDLIDPATDIPPVLEMGPAILRVTGEGLITTSASDYDGDISNIPIEILPGQGSPNPLNTYTTLGADVHPMASLEPLPQIDISPSPSEPVYFGGANIVLRYVDADFAYSPPPRAVPATQDPNVQIFSDYEPQGDGITTLIKIYIMNPRGFLPTNGHTGLQVGASDLHSLSIRLIWSGNSSVVINDSNWQNSVQLVSGDYIDINGDVIAGITPVLTKVR